MNKLEVPKLSPENLVITRKRKKWKFAHFDAYQNCFQHERDDDPDVAGSAIKAYLEPGKPLVLELAAGNAQFSLELAKRHPDYNFIAIDIKSDRLYTSAKQALEEGVTNIAFLRMSMHELGNVFDAKTIDTIWLTFPDPFMRSRSKRRRLSHPIFLRQYKKLLVKGGTFKFKTDNQPLFLWSLEQFVAEQWQFKELTFDLHESDLHEDYKIMTYYEKKFIAEGFTINYTCLTADEHETNSR